jgi:hypothetical protein
MGAMNDDGDDLETIDLAAAPGSAPAQWPEGWYADPWTAGQYRYWNGQTWTGATHRWGPSNQPLAGGDAWPAAASGLTRGYAAPASPLSEVEPPPQRRRSRGMIVAAVIALVAVLVASGAIGYAINANSQDNEGAVRVTPGPSTTVPPSVPESNDPDRRVLGDIVVRQTDVGNGRKVLLYENGNSLGGATLDLCNGRFPSESSRTARLQLLDVDAQGSSSLSTEAVLYRSPDAAKQAFAELRAARKDCPDTPVASPIDGSEETTEFQAAPDAGWPATEGVQRQAYRMTITGQGESSPLVTVYLRRGRAFLGLYFPAPHGEQPAVAGKRSIEDIVSVFEARLAALPESVVNATVGPTT